MQISAINAALGRKVASLRKVQGLSQAQLAEQFGAELGKTIDPTAITRLEQGRRPVAVHELVALARILGVEPTVFFKFLGPLDDATGAMESRAEGASAKAKLAALVAAAAFDQLQALRRLQEYRDSRDAEALADGVMLLYTTTEWDRTNWRDLFLDAGVPEQAIAAALEAVPDAIESNPSSEKRLELAKAIFKATTKPAKRVRR